MKHSNKTRTWFCMGDHRYNKKNKTETNTLDAAKVTSVKLQQLYLSLNRLALLQILIGLASVAVSVSAVGKDRANFPTIEEQQGKAVKYIILGLDVGAVIGSAWFVLSGLVPFYMKSTKRGLVKTKVAFMVCCIMSASLFVPFVFGAACTSVALRINSAAKDLALPGLMAAIALLEMCASIISAVYCCKSEWAECKLVDKPTDVENGKDEIDKEEKKRQKEERKKEKKEKKRAEKENEKEKEKLTETKEDSPPPYNHF